MKIAQAEDGYHSTLYVAVELANGRELGWTWVTTDSHLVLPRLALSWARAQLRRDKVPGRSSIVGLSITSKQVEGDYPKKGART